jgi:hypothetical protein
LANGTPYYFVVSVAGSSTNSNQVQVFPFDTVGGAGQFEGGQFEPYQVNSAAPSSGKPALVGLPGILGDISRTEVGSKGYVIYNWADGGTDQNSSKPVPFTNKTNLVSPVISVTLSETWYNEKRGMSSRFTIDGRSGLDSAIAVRPNATASLTINVSDTQVHHLTVVSPDRYSDLRDFTIKLTGQNSHKAFYTVNEARKAGKTHVFQFEFTGNATLSITNNDTPAHDSIAAVQALFFD